MSSDAWIAVEAGGLALALLIAAAVTDIHRHRRRAPAQDGWTCSCGRQNDADEANCYGCGRAHNDDLAAW